MISSTSVGHTQTSTLRAGPHHAAAASPPAGCMTCRRGAAEATICSTAFRRCELTSPVSVQCTLDAGSASPSRIACGSPLRPTAVTRPPSSPTKHVPGSRPHMCCHRLGAGRWSRPGESTTTNDRVRRSNSRSAASTVPASVRGARPAASSASTDLPRGPSALTRTSASVTTPAARACPIVVRAPRSAASTMRRTGSSPAFRKALNAVSNEPSKRTTCSGRNGFRSLVITFTT